MKKKSIFIIITLLLSMILVFSLFQFVISLSNLILRFSEIEMYVSLNYSQETIITLFVNCIISMFEHILLILLTTFFILIFILLNKHKTLLEASKYVYFNFEVLKQERIEKRLQKENAKKEKKNNKIQRKIEKLNNMKDDI